jgi:nucleotide-binding universal stress UspA family protein
MAGERMLAIKSILVATDLSAQENAAIRRASQLATAHRATLKLMYMPPHGEPPMANAAARLATATRDLQENLELRVKTVSPRLHRLQDLVAASEGMDLVVLPHRRERSTAAFFRGQPVLRVLRGCSCPVLVSRGAGLGHYRRILVGLDFSPGSEQLVRIAADFDPRAELELFHAVSSWDEATLRSEQATEQSVLAYQERCLRHARDRMLTLTHSFEARRNRVRTVIGRGDPGMETVVQQEHSGADLVVLGKRRTSAWEDFFCASVAHRVLSWGSSDVLVVPSGHVPRTASIAARRLRRGKPPLGLEMHSVKAGLS